MKIRLALVISVVLAGLADAGPFFSQSLSPIDAEKTWAVVIGISNYTSEEVAPLRFAASDALAFAEFLKSPRGGGLRTDRVQLLLEGEATAFAIRTRLGFLGEKVQNGDSVYIFIAGHGVLTSRGLAYFVPSDGTLSQVYGDSVNFEELKNLVVENLAHAKVRILMTDVCHAGRFDETPNRVNEYLTGISPKAGKFLNLLASGPAESSFEREDLGAGIFTHVVLNALNGKASPPGIPIVDAKAVVDFVQTEVPRLTARQQNPRSNSGFDPRLPLALLDRPGPTLQPVVQTSLIIRNTNRTMFDRVEWVDPRYRARATRKFAKEAETVQLNGLPADEIEFKFGSPDLIRIRKYTLRPGENVLDILSDRFEPANSAQVASLRSFIPSSISARQSPVTAASAEAVLLLKLAAGTSVLLDGSAFATSLRSDEFIQLDGISPGVHNLTLITPAQREYRFRLRLLPGAQVFDLASGETKYILTPAQDPATEPLPTGLPANLVNTYRNFSLAIWDERLLAPAGNSAWDFYTQMRNSLPARLRDQLTEQLIIAMGNRSQQTIVKYLRGEDIRWSADVFEMGALLSDRVQQLFQFRSDIQRDIQSRQSFFAGRALIARGRYPEGIAQLQRSINLFPEASHAYNAIGFAYWKQSLFEQAIPPLQQAINLTPRWIYPRNILALVLFELRRYDEAEQAFQTALLLRPDDSSLHHGLGQLYLLLGRITESEARLQRAIESNPGNAYAVHTYGQLERLRNNLDEAERLFRLAIRLEPDEPSFAASLGELLRQRGRIAEAQPIFTQMAKAYPSDFTAVRAYTGFLASQNRASDARAVFEQAVKLAPKVANLRVSYGEFLRAQGRNNDAEKQYKEAISAAAANPFAHYGLANVYLSRGRLTQAEREIDAATKADPRYPRALMLLGHIRSAQQRYTESIEAYNKAITLEVDRARRQELNESIEEAKRASAMLAIQSAQRDIEKNRLKSAWTTYAGVLRIAPEDPSLIEALLKFENQFGTSADVSHLPSSALSSALQTPFWRKLRDAEALWNSGKREDGGRAFFEALDTLSLEDRQKITATAFNVRNENYGIHQIVYRWAMRMIELRDLTGAQNLMESSMRQKIFDFVPGASTTTVASLMSPADTKEPKTFADFEVAHNPDLRAHEILAVLYALQGNNTKSEDFLTALNIEQRVEVRNRIQRLSR